MYTRDGITGVCMIAADLYEGIRPAQHADHADVAALLGMLRDSGYELPFPLEDLGYRLECCITVLEREGKVGMHGIMAACLVQLYRRPVLPCEMQS